MHRTERKFFRETSERLRRAMIGKLFVLCSWTSIWLTLRSRGLRDLLSIALSCSGQLADTNGTHGGGRHAAASGVFQALFGLALGSPRTRTAPAVVVDRQGSFAAPFRACPLQRVRSRGQTCHPAVGNLPASRATWSFGDEKSACIARNVCWA
jgi:hypothetical protein